MKDPELIPDASKMPRLNQTTGARRRKNGPLLIGSGIGVIVIAWILIMMIASLPPLPGALPLPSYPPSGSIWFGQAYDPAAINRATYTLIGVTTSFPKGGAIGMEASLPTGIGGRELIVHVTISGRDRIVDTSDPAPEGDEVFFDVLPANLFVNSGSVSVAVVDSSGEVLAEGTLEVH